MNSFHQEHRWGEECDLAVRNDELGKADPKAFMLTTSCTSRPTGRWEGPTGAGPSPPMQAAVTLSCFSLPPAQATVGGCATDEAVLSLGEVFDVSTRRTQRPRRLPNLPHSTSLALRPSGSRYAALPARVSALQPALASARDGPPWCICAGTTTPPRSPPNATFRSPQPTPTPASPDRSGAANGSPL